MKKLTRRELAVGTTGLLAGAQMIAQTRPASGSDADKAARDSHLENAAVLSRFDISMFVEPAFQFKA